MGSMELDDGSRRRVSEVEVTAATSPAPENGEKTEKGRPVDTEQASQVGVSIMEASQAVWGRSGLRLVVAGLAMIMILFELDNATVYVYNNYSTSSFGKLSALATLSTATTIVFAVVKPPFAKLSNVIGRGWTLVVTMSFYMLGYILMASASGIGPYAAGSMSYAIGQSGTNVMTTVIISDITTPRWRGFALGMSYFPFLITPWVSALMVEGVVNGIGWRWGIGMFALLMPFGASFIISALIYYQRKAKKMGLFTQDSNMTARRFCSEIDLGGVVLFVAGFALLLVPVSMAGAQPDGWKTPWVMVLMILGLFLLLALPAYEKYVALYPVLPVFYFRNATIVLSVLMIATDSLAFSCSHAYLYAWSVVSHDLSARDATFYTYTNGVTQCLAGMFAGYLMLATGRFKWLTMTGAVIRVVGYGAMLRLRGQDNSTAELFVQQIIQGIGSGIIQTTLLVPPQVVVPHVHVSQVLALVFSAAFLGSSVGSAVAGGIYTNALRPALWKYLGDKGTPELIESLFGSITGDLPAWGSEERVAINYAYSDVIKNMTYAALGASVPALVMCLFIPNLLLPNERKHLFQPHGGLVQDRAEEQKKTEGGLLRLERRHERGGHTRGLGPLRSEPWLEPKDAQALSTGGDHVPLLTGFPAA